MQLQTGMRIESLPQPCLCNPAGGRWAKNRIAPARDYERSPMPREGENMLAAGVVLCYLKDLMSLNATILTEEDWHTK